MSWFSPYLLAEGQVDTRSLSRILASEPFVGKRDRDLALALWRWMIDPQKGFYHWLNPVEEPGEPLAGDPVKDPLRLINSYGYGLCGSAATIFASLYDWAGGLARVVGATGHSISEAYWGDAWHLIDCDLRAIHYKEVEAGLEIASLHDLVTRPDLVSKPIVRSEPYYPPTHKPEDVAASVYAPGRETYLPRYFYRLGSMDYVLRPAESLTYYYQPQGRFIYPASWRESVEKRYGEGFAGPFDRLDPSRTYANVCIRWRPRLDVDVPAVGIDASGFEPAGGGLRASRDEAVLTYRLVSPYVITGRFEGGRFGGRRLDAVLVRMVASARPKLRVHTPRDDAEVELEPTGDNGRFFADLTEFLERHYEYRLDVVLPRGETLYSVAVDTWAQVSLMCLPEFWRQAAKCRLMAGGECGPRVLPHLIDLLGRLRAGIGKLEQGTLCGEGPDRLVPESGLVSATVPVEPPIEGEILRIHAVAAVKSAPYPTEATGFACLEIATDESGPYVILERRPIWIDKNCFHFSVEAVHTLTQPTRRVWLRLRATRPVALWRVRVDYEPTVANGANVPLDVLLRWRQQGRLKTFTKRFDSPQQDVSFGPVVSGDSVQPMHAVLSAASLADLQAS